MMSNLNSGMSREVQQSVNVSDTDYDNVDSDLLVNQLIYEVPKSLSLAIEKTIVSFYPLRSTYSVGRNSTMSFTINSGNYYIDPYDSTLDFKMVASGNQAVVGPTFGSNGANALIHESRFKTRSGTDCTRLEHYNVYTKHKIDYEMSQAWIDSIGAGFFFNNSTVLFNAGNTLVTEVSIPLYLVHPLFNPLKKGQLLPPQLMSGGLLELPLEEIERAFFDPNGYFGAGSSLELSDIKISASCVTLSDDTTKMLNLESAESGLEVCYNAVYNYNNTYNAGSTAMNVQISKAVSQASHVFAAIYNTANYSLSTVDSFLVDSFLVTAWQYRIGSQYMPHQSVLSNVGATITNKGTKSYLIALSSFDKLKHSFSETSVTAVDYSTNKSIIAVSLERNSSLALSGTAINNSRILELLLERDGSADGGDTRTIYTFMTYAAIARAYIDNVAVAI